MDAIVMVGMGRVELPTYRLGGGCSIHLSYIPGLMAVYQLRRFYRYRAKPF